MVKENLDTSIDRLVEYINANGSVTVTNAAKVLALNPDEVEKLGEMLAESGLISIRYELTNTILTSKKKPEVKPTLTPKFKQLAVEESKKIEKQVLDTESIFEFIEADLNKRINIAQNNLKKLSEQTNVDEKEVEKTEKEVQKVIEELHVMENKVNDLYKKIYLFDQQLQTFKDNIKKLERKKPSLIDKIKNFLGFKTKVEVIPETEVEEPNELKERAKLIEKKIESKNLQPLESKEIIKTKTRVPRTAFQKIIEKQRKTRVKPEEKLEPSEMKTVKLKPAPAKNLKKLKTTWKKTRAKRSLKTRVKILKFKRKGVWIKAWFKNGRFYKIKELKTS